MSALGSSVINKSSKKLAPRAPPPRRRAAAAAAVSEPTQTILPTPPVSQDAARTSPSAVDQNQIDSQDTSSVPAAENTTLETPPRKRRRVAPSNQNTESISAIEGNSSPNQLNVLQDHTSADRNTAAPRITRSNTTQQGAELTINDGAASIESRAPSTITRRTRSRGSGRPSQTATSSTTVEEPSRTSAVPEVSVQQTQMSKASKRTKPGQQRPTVSTRTHDNIDSNLHNSAQTEAVREQQGNKSKSKSLKRQQTQDIDPSLSPAESRENAEEQGHKEINSQQQEPSAKPARKRRKTPEGAQNREINTTATLMFDLRKDSKSGQKSKLESEFQEIDWSEVVRLRKEAEARAREELLANAPTRDQQPATEATQAQDESQGPRLKLINGQIVLDNSSLLVDRHAGAIPSADQPAVEERDITRRINSSTWLHDNRRDPEERQLLSSKSDPWKPDATERFYNALRMWGTDFFMISKMFPGRTRRHIKLKFVREERANPDRIRQALIGGSVPMDLEAYCEATGKSVDDYKDPRVLHEELKVEEERQKLEIERQKEELALAQRKKQEAAAAKAASNKGKKGMDRGGTGAGLSRTKKRKKQDVLDDGLGSAADVVESVEV